MASALSYSTILVPLDAAADSDRADLFDLADQMARLHDASLVFLTVVPELYLPTAADPGSVVAAMKDQASRRFDAALADRWPDIDSSRRLLRHGPVAGTIIEVAREVDADLIMMNARRPGIAAYALGSVASRVVNYAHVSVFVVREPGT